MDASFAHPAPHSPLLAFVLFEGDPPDIDALATALREEFTDAVRVQTVAPEGKEPTPTAVVQAEGVSVLVAPVAAPVPGGEAVRACHPLWWRDRTPVEEHRSHVIITTLCSTDREDPRARALHQATLLSIVGSLVLGLEGAVGFYYAEAGVTFPPDAYLTTLQHAFEQEEPPIDLWVSVWLRPREDGTTSGYTLGLDTFGHADLVVRDSRRPPSEVYELLASVAAHLVASGARLEPGHTLGYSAEDQAPVTAVESEVHGAKALLIG